LNAKIQYSVYQSLPVVSVLSQINPVNILLARFSYLCVGLQVVSFVEASLLEPSMHFSFPPYMPLALPVSYIDEEVQVNVKHSEQEILPRISNM
jgi:hypothetical protein